MLLSLLRDLADPLTPRVGDGEIVAHVQRHDQDAHHDDLGQRRAERPALRHGRARGSSPAHLEQRLTFENDIAAGSEQLLVGGSETHLKTVRSSTS